MSTKILILVLAFGVLPSTAWAKEQRRAIRTNPTSKSWVTFEKRKQRSPWRKEAGWANQAGKKFVFGAKNTLFGWTELLTEPSQAAKNNQSVTRGLGRGVVHSVVDTVGGAVHLVTFPVTSLDWPLPQGGVGS